MSEYEKKMDPEKEKGVLEGGIEEGDKSIRDSQETVVDQSEPPNRDAEDLSLKSNSDGENSVFGDNPENSDNHTDHHDNPSDSKPTGESENDSEELDDIELIFTTDDTRDVGLQEDLVSIIENETWPLPRHRQPDGQPVLLVYKKSSELDSMVNGDKTNSSVEEAASSQSSSIDREESIDRFDEGSGARLNRMSSQCSVLVETDISKCGVLEEPDTSRYAARRNTLAAPPTAAYRSVSTE